MLVKPANKLINGMETKVYDPDTGKALARDAIIDLDTLHFTKQQHYLRVLADGDLVEVHKEKKSTPPVQDK